MEILKWIVLAVTWVCFLVNCALAIRSRKLLRLILLNGVLGLVSLFVIYLTKKFTAFLLPINEWTVAGSSVFGISGVVGMVILPFIFA